MDLTQNFYKGVLDNLYDGVYYVDCERRIIYWNRGAERTTGYSSDQVLGNSCSDNILIHVDDQGKQLCNDGCPLALTIADGQMRTADFYLHHASGHRVPVSIRVSPTYNERGEINGAVEIFSDNSAKVAALERITGLQQAALIDHLTGVGNRRYTEMKIEASLNELRQQQLPFGLILADIDHFKAINDTLGHAAGDQVLKMIAQTLRNNILSFDFIGRWGGEEFVLLIFNEEEENLFKTSEKLRMLVQNSRILIAGEVIQATISLGVACAHPDDTLQELFDRADQLMYQSKAAGRNCTSIYGKM